MKKIAFKIHICFKRKKEKNLFKRISKNKNICENEEFGLLLKMNKQINKYEIFLKN